MATFPILAVLLFDLLLANYRALVAITDQSMQFRSFELSKSPKAGLGKRLIITDDNMGWEWRDTVFDDRGVNIV